MCSDINDSYVIPTQACQIKYSCALYKAPLVMHNNIVHIS